MSYGLLGKTLKHSFSKEIHENFTNKQYTLFESDDLKEFFTSNQFSGINVTIPYKHDVIQYLDELSTEAEALQSINTIIRSGGKLKGYNTDYYGLDKALYYSHISVSNQEVIILGNGSTSRTIKYYCEQNLAKKITILARNPKEYEYHFSSVDNFNTATIIFNATPVGMFPNNNDPLPISLDKLPNLISVVDLVYNPLHSSLIIEAKKRHLSTVNGLLMLIFQALKSIELFHTLVISDEEALKYYKKLEFRMRNLVFIGMPMSGKTFFAKLVAKKYHKDVIDLDKEIEHNAKMSIPLIFKKYGETHFRSLETTLVEDFSKRHNKAISCGGGVILNPINMDYLKQNGIIIFLDMPLSLLKKCNPKGRPLLEDKENLENLYQARYHLYQDYADITISKTNFDQASTLHQIEVKLHEYINS